MGYHDNNYGYGLASYGYAPPPPPLHPNQMDPFNQSASNGVPQPSNGAQYRGLNVTDPRFAAKYGNPFLRTTPPTQMNANGGGGGGGGGIGNNQPPSLNPNNAAPNANGSVAPLGGPMNPMSGGGGGSGVIGPNNQGSSQNSPMMNHRYNNNRPYATLNTRSNGKVNGGQQQQQQQQQPGFSPVHHDAPIRNGTLTKNGTQHNGMSRVMAVDGGSGMNHYILSPESEVKPGALATHV